MPEGPEPLSQWLAREGAASVERTLTWATQLGAQLLTAGERADVGLELIDVAADGSLVLRAAALEGGARAQVRRLAAVVVELLKGSPPPAAPDAGLWVGVRPSLAKPLAAALAGTGAADVGALLAQLQASGQTAAFVAAQPDTIPSTVPSVAMLPRGRRTGTLLGSYELLDLLGSGGMGEVYRARHARLGREVAVKVLRDEWASTPDVVQRFFQEARVVNDINHPNIVQISDFVDTPGAVFCVMELLPGHSLAHVVQHEGPLALRRIEVLMRQVCQALAAAHARGVVHRDIKPDNIFVLPGDRVKVLDFGIARRLAAGTPQTLQGVVMGTPTYMAPEQAAGRAVDVRADLYSLGVVLYELFTNGSIQLVAAPERLVKTAAGEPLPRALTEVLEECLSLDPSNRPRSVDAVRLAFEPRRSRRGWLVGVAVVGLSAALAIAWWPARVASPSGLDAGVALAVNEVAPPVAPAPPVEPPLDAPPLLDAGRARPSRRSELVKQATRLRARFQRLAAKPGAQLTSIEKEVLRSLTVGIDHATDSELTELISDANKALSEAEGRLNR